MNLDHRGYDTDCLNDVEFFRLHLYHYHIKFYDRSIGKIISEIWEGSDKEEVLNSFNDWKKSYMWLRSIRKGKLAYPEVHKKLEDFNKLSEEEKEKALDTRDNVGV